MNNLSQTRTEAKQLYLKRQRSKVIDQLKGASLEERKTVIRHIDGFIDGCLESTTLDGRIFWLKVRREVERQIEREM